MRDLNPIPPDAEKFKASEIASENAAVAKKEHPITTFERTASREQDAAELASIRESLSEHEDTEALSPDQKHEINQNLLRFKETLNNSKVTEKMKKFLMGAEVSTVVMGVKPASYLQPSMQKKLFGLFKEREGLTKKDLDDSLKILNQLGVDSKISEDFADNKKLHSIEILHIWRKDKVLDTMKGSGMFKDEEITSAEKDIGNFFQKNLSTKYHPQSEVMRTGTLYGYPKSDVEDEIKRVSQGEANLQSKKTTINIKGINDGIQWRTYNPDNPDTKATIKKFESAIEMQKQIFGQ